MADSKDLAAEYADTVSRSISEKMAAMQSDDYELRDEAVQAVDEYPLEVVFQAGSPFEVVITVGGPDARIVSDLRWGGFYLEVVWGGDKAVRRGEWITAMGEYFLEMVES